MQNQVEIRNKWFADQVGKLTESGMAQADIAEKLGVLPQYLNAILNNRRNASEKFVNKFCEKFNINQNDLLQKMQNYHSVNLSDHALEPEPLHKSENRIPFVLVSAIAGFGNLSFSISKSDVKEYYTVPKFKDRNIDFMIEITGTSMYPKYNSGDVVACTILRESKFIQWNKAHVIGTLEQGILVKRIRRGPDEDHFILVSDNPDYEPFTISRAEITGIALVVGVIRLE